MGKHEKIKGLHPKQVIYDEISRLPENLTAAPAHMVPMPPQSFGFVPAPAPPLPPVTHRLSTANMMSTSDAAVAKVSYEIPPEPGKTWGLPRRFEGSGTSKRERGDSHDPLTGEVLAMARAYEELAARLHRFARGRIKAQDSERRQREIRKSKEAQKAEQAVESIDVTQLVGAELRKALTQLKTIVEIFDQQ